MRVSLGRGMRVGCACGDGLVACMSAGCACRARWRRPFEFTLVLRCSNPYKTVCPALKTLRGKGKLSEANMREGLGLVQRALLEADVSLPVVKNFVGRVSEKALGERVLASLDPSQQVIGIVHDELVDLMGPVDHSLHLQPGVTVLMLCGLQGSGKTTTCGKLGRLIKERGRKPLLVAADLQRPAAIEQLHVIGEQLGIPVYSEEGARIRSPFVRMPSNKPSSSTPVS